MHATSLISLVVLLASTSAFATPTNNTGPSSCGRDEFWFSDKTCCLKNGGPANTPTVPTGKSCPDKWYWHSQKSCCTPRNQVPPTTQTTPDCPGTHIWDRGNTCCRAPTKNDCKSSEWWWEARSCCLGHGQPPNPPSPPTGSKCPKNGWNWNNKQGCCAPHHPNPPEEPDCDDKWKWDKPSKCCKPHNNPPPPPTPSNKPPHKRDAAAAAGAAPVGKRTPHSRRKSLQKQVQFCPTGLTQCPVKGVLGEYECIDTMSELESCGGCASLGKGKDCNKIANATTSSCLGGSCVVLACDSGYKISADGESCVSPL